MKKLIIAAVIAAIVVPTIAVADRGGHYREPSRHGGGGVNPWPFIAGAVIGGIIVHESGRNREYNPPQRYITVCEDIMLYDSNGRYVKSERYCHQELVSGY